MRTQFNTFPRTVVQFGLIFASTALFGWTSLIVLNPIALGDDGQRKEYADGVVPTEADTLDWIRDLGSDNYSRRQLAMISLQKNLSFALPSIIAASRDAKGDHAEQLIQLLAQAGAKPTGADGKKAYDALQLIAKDRSSSKAMMATRVLKIIALAQREEAISRLRMMHVDVRDRDLQVLTSASRPVRDALVINDLFNGDIDDLECMRWLTNVYFVRLEGPKINRKILEHVITIPTLTDLQIIRTNLNAQDIEVLEQGPDLKLLEILYTPLDDTALDALGRLPILNDVHLFGTKISRDGQSKLKEQIEGANVFVSRGGFLGVQCEPTGLVIMTAVKGGPADNAGISRNDKLLKIAGVEIFVFEDLRKQLANFAAGETVEVEYETDRYVSNGFGRNRLDNFPQLPMPRRVTVNVVLGERNQ